MYSDPVACTFSNEELRPACDILDPVYTRLERLAARANALGVEAALLAEIQAGRGGEYLDDGSPADGRRPRTVQEAYALIQIVKGLIATPDDPGLQALIGSAAPRDLIMAFAVNPRKDLA